MILRTFLVLLILWTYASTHILLAQSKLGSREAATSSTESAKTIGDAQQVVARVGDQPITLAEVYFQLGKQPAPDGSMIETPLAILMTTIHIIAQQRRSLVTLEKSGSAVADKVVDSWLEENNPALEGQTGKEIAILTAKSAGVSEQSLRQLLTWRISWQRYLAKHLTTENIQKHFNKQPGRFDGSRYRVEHVFVSVLPGNSSDRMKAQTLLNSIRPQLADGQMTFAQAVKLTKSQFKPELVTKNITSDNSDIEPQWTSGSGPLHPWLIDEIVKLRPKEISVVISTPLGEHLIRLLEVEPGNRKLEDAIADIRRHMLLYLLDFTANQHVDRLPLVIDESLVTSVAK